MRELGKEKFRNSYFATEKKDLEKEGWEKWERSEGAEVQKPLSKEEEVLMGVKEDEEREGGRGTGERRLVGGGRARLGVAREVMERLGELSRGSGANLVMFVCFHHPAIGTVGDLCGQKGSSL